MASELKHTVKPSGGDFTTLSAAVAHIKSTHTNLVTADVYALVEIDGDWTGVEDNTAVSVDGITTDATHYISIYATSACKHSGTWDATKYRLIISNADAFTVSGVNYVRLDGIQVSVPAVNADSQDCIVLASLSASNNDIRLSNLIIKGANDSTYIQKGVNSGSNNGNVYGWNIIAYNFYPSTTVSISPFGIACATASFYKCTGIGGRRAFSVSSGTVLAKNCYIGGAGQYCYYGTMTMTTCGSSDTTGSAGLQSIAVNTSNFVNVTAGSEDFHIPTGSALKDVGTDTSGDAAPMNFTTDIDGQAITGTWDIGADEWTSSSTPITITPTQQSCQIAVVAPEIHEYFVGIRRSTTIRMDF